VPKILGGQAPGVKRYRGSFDRLEPHVPAPLHMQRTCSIAL